MDIASSEISIAGASLGNSLMSVLMCDEIVPGTDVGYFAAKTIYVSHPLGAKMAEAPISMAQSQDRDITIQDSPSEVIQEFKKKWKAYNVDSTIHNVMSLSRVYGLSTVVLGNKSVASSEPLDMTKLWNQEIYFNVLDPLNTAGSLVLSQIPTSPDFNKPVTVRTSGETFHPSRFQVVMNEHPVYLEYTSSAFGFVGRSVYQRALYPLKSFIASMIADDMIATKLGLLVSKQKSPGSAIDKMMTRVAALKRTMLKGGKTGNVLQIGHEDMIETLNMQNVDGAGTYSRTNILKNIATAADMPAKLLENETMVAGFGEGTEDAKNIARYIDRVRMKMQPVYEWFDNIIQYVAWSEPFFERMKAKYPEKYSGMEYRDAFSEWRHNYSAVWPSLLTEPESEQMKGEAVKFECAVALLQSLLPEFDPRNKVLLIQSALANIGENKRIFPHDFDNLDYDALIEFFENKEQTLQEPESESDKLAKFDSVAFKRVREAVSQLPPKFRKTGLNA